MSGVRWPHGSGGRFPDPGLLGDEERSLGWEGRPPRATWLADGGPGLLMGHHPGLVLGRRPLTSHTPHRAPGGAEHAVVEHEGYSGHGAGTGV